MLVFLILYIIPDCNVYVFTLTKNYTINDDINSHSSFYIDYFCSDFIQ